MIRKGAFAVLILLAMGTCLAWAFRPESLVIVDLQENEAARLESHWVLFLDPGGLIIDYGVYTWRTAPRQYFSPRVAGFAYAHHQNATQEYRSVRIPYWALLLLFVTYPTVAFIRGPLRRYRRRKKGLCVACGYDLTGNESGVCSECGDER